MRIDYAHYTQANLRRRKRECKYPWYKNLGQRDRESPDMAPGLKATVPSGYLKVRSAAPIICSTSLQKLNASIGQGAHVSHKFSSAFVLLLLLSNAKAFSATASDSAEAAAAPPVVGPESALNPHFGVVVKASMLGVGGDAGVSLTRLANVRVGYNGLSFSKRFSYNGINYDGKLQFRSAEALVDLTP
jgi:hypothetical protein